MTIKTQAPFIKKVLLTSAAIGFLALPSVYAQDKQPQQAVPVKTTSSPVEPAVNNPAAMDLRGALEQAYRFNPVLKSERNNLAAIDERVAQALSEWRPTVEGQYVRGRQRSDYSNTGDVYSTNETKGISIEQPIFNGGGSIARFNATKLDVKAGRARLQSVTQEILLQSISAYMDTVRDKAVLDLSRNNVGVLNKQLDASEDRFSVGEVTRTDVAQSKARLSRAASDEAQAEGSLIASKATFKRVIGVGPDMLQAPLQIPEVPGTLDETIDIALKNNPNLQRSSFEELSSKSVVNSEKSRILPTVSLRGAMQRQQGAGVFGRDDYDVDSVTMNVRVPLYQSGSEYSRVRQASSNYEKAKYDTADANNDTIERATRAWQALETSRATIQATKSSIEAAEIALDGVKQEQQYGARTVLDVLDAEQELFVAKVNLVRAQRDEIVAAYTLLGVMGQLTPERLELNVAVYNPEEHYEKVKYKPFGF